jgi:catechol 2,3-dioxygenase-like lactoylglutathione lyase family enzyme
MENNISTLVSQYERGSLSRRQLIQGLTLLVGSTLAAGGAVAAPAGALETANLDHVSLQAGDVEKTAAFYKSVFGLPVLNEDKATKTIRLSVGSAGGRIAIRQVEPHGVVDHFCLSVSNFNKAAATEKLKQIGVTTFDTGEPLNFHVVDPDGYPVQILAAR